MRSYIFCPTPDCGAVLRQKNGVIFGDEPFVWSDESGPYVRCPKCLQRIGWPVEPGSGD